MRIPTKCRASTLLTIPTSPLIHSSASKSMVRLDISLYTKMSHVEGSFLVILLSTKLEHWLQWRSKGMAVSSSLKEMSVQVCLVISSPMHSWKVKSRPWSSTSNRVLAVQQVPVSSIFSSCPMSFRSALIRSLFRFDWE
jgi:hypothetical protein